MTSATILLVEDNPITRKMLRFALESEGYSVADAGDGRGALEAVAARRPDLLVLDYALPDVDGLGLLEVIRRRLGAPELPAIVITGMVSRLGELRARGGPSTQLVAKPVEPSQLLDIVAAQLAPPAARGAGRRILVVDDEPLNRKLALRLLGNAGYEVEVAAGGAEALALARCHPPDAVLADVLMPGMDGFAFCREARNDALLAAVPIVLVSASYAEEADRRLAREMGANALALRTSDLREAVAALEAALRQPAPPPRPTNAERVDALHRERLQVQLERQTARNEALLQQGAIQATALSIIRGLSEVLAQPADISQILGDVLVHCLDAAGLSTGLLYVVEPGGRHRLQAQFGLSAAARAEAESFFGHPELIDRLVAARQPAALSAEAPDAATRDLLARLGHSSALVLPFVVLGEFYGELVLASDSHDFTDSSWLGFARSVALQFGQTVALGQSLKRVAESEEQYRLLFDSNPFPMCVFDRDTLRILAVNEAAVRHYGYSRDEFLAMTVKDFRLPEDPALAEGIEWSRPVVGDGGTYRLPAPVKHRTKDCRVIEVDVAASRLDFRGRPAWLTLVSDVTEKRSLEAQLFESQKIESLGRLAGGVAHDFNNLLLVISGYGELLRARIGAEPELAEYVDNILLAAERAAALTRQLLAFSRKQVLQPEVLDLSALVAETEKMLRRLIGEDIQLVTALDDDLGPVRADAGQMDQVLMNLAVNARDAMPAGGRLTIETANIELGEAYARQHAGVEPGAYVLLAVSDTGHGMTPEVQARIFEPFFTTKAPGKGTGLGLATLHGIVKQSGGHVGVYSEPGHGTTVKVYLPRAAGAKTAAAAPPPAETERPRGSETILVVEDEAILRELLRKCLEAAGYTVILARNGPEALAICERQDSAIDLLLTDLVMPEMSGREVAHRVRAKIPGIHLLYMSGYTDDAVVVHGVLDEDMAFLQKPFTPQTLARKVREVLEQPDKG